MSLIKDGDELLGMFRADGGFGSKQCSDCHSYACHKEGVPYGDTTAYREVGMCVCTAVEECPAYEVYLVELIEQAKNELEAIQ